MLIFIIHFSVALDTFREKGGGVSFRFRCHLGESEGIDSGTIW